MRQRSGPGRQHAVAVAILLATLLAGCDSATTDTIVLGDVRVSFEFEFSGGSLAAGRLSDVTSDGSANIGAQLSSLGGFSLDEIVTGEVTAAEVELIFPFGSGNDLRAFSELVLQLRAGSTVREVASRTGFASEDPTTMNVIRNRDISTILGGGDFDAVLQVEPANVDPAEDYTVGVVLTLSVEVEGV